MKSKISKFYAALKNCQNRLKFKLQLTHPTRSNNVLESTSKTHQLIVPVI